VDDGIVGDGEFVVVIDVCWWEVYWVWYFVIFFVVIFVVL